MKLDGAVALVTGGQEGLGSAFTTQLLEAGAKKVYVGSRHPADVGDARVIPMHLDVREESSVAAFAERAADVDLVINNAGVYHYTPLLTTDFDLIRDEFETNVLGVVSIARSFSPILHENGGGTMLNVLALLSWLSAGDGYSATKAAAWSVTNGLPAPWHPWAPT